MNWSGLGAVALAILIWSLIWAYWWYTMR